jgi:hypothetical protein
MKEFLDHNSGEDGVEKGVELKLGLNAVMAPEFGGYGNLPQSLEQTRLELQQFLDKLDNAGGIIVAAFPVKVDMGRPRGYASNLTETRILFVVQKGK